MKANQPRAGDVYRDERTRTLLEVVGVAVDATTSRRTVIYRVKNSEGLIALGLAEWSEAIAVGALRLVRLAKP